MTSKIIFIIGVSGSGKTTVGRLISNKLEIPYLEADDFHPDSNIKKMSAGTPLNDDDRLPWLEKLNRQAIQHAQLKGAVISCSALKKKYRNILVRNLESKIHWIYLKGDIDLIKSRMRRRVDHFMPEALLQSQFEILEEPTKGITIDISESTQIITSKILKEIDMKNEFGIIGMGVMGRSIARNMAGRGKRLSLFNRYVKGTEEEVALRVIDEFTELEQASGFENISEFVKSLETPRKMLIMVKAGAAVSAVIDELVPELDPGDIIIDGGNSHFKDSEKRFNALSEKGIHFIGSGISGGEEGALKGPSIMPGGDKAAYEKVRTFLEDISATDARGTKCCTLIGSAGAGHFVKMIHNGIEYAEMQLIAEVYSIMRKANDMNPDEIADELESWNQSDLNSYLLEITIDILRKKEGDGWLIDAILDQAGNKGTGSWSTTAACELGVPATMICAALFARYTSAFHEDRQRAHEVYLDIEHSENSVSVETLQNAYRAARLINHHQGFFIIARGSESYNWNINLKELARIWTNGCIIRSKLMEDLIDTVPADGQLLFSKEVSQIIKTSLQDLKDVTAQFFQIGLPAPCLTAAVNYINAFWQKESSANVIQAQRDYFGAHTYKRKNDASGKAHHTQWI